MLTLRRVKINVKIDYTNIGLLHNNSDDMYEGKSKIIPTFAITYLETKVRIIFNFTSYVLNFVIVIISVYFKYYNRMNLHVFIFLYLAGGHYRRYIRVLHLLPHLNVSRMCLIFYTENLHV